MGRLWLGGGASSCLGVPVLNCTRCTFTGEGDVQTGSGMIPRSGGQYMKKVTYEYVGEGNGEFDQPAPVVVSFMGQARNRFTWQSGGLFFFALVLAVLMVLMLLTSTSSSSTLAVKAAAARSAGERNMTTLVVGHRASSGPNEHRLRGRDNDEGRAESKHGDGGRDSQTMDLVPSVSLPPEERKALEVRFGPPEAFISDAIATDSALSTAALAAAAAIRGEGPPPLQSRG
mmetsp:Transcript_39900/g.127881  ORF Transcript_39900/g.127881 Transcript_39900/m.127881 type:complete len:230 (-) Transcript_39900:731-1420(-)